MKRIYYGLPILSLLVLGACTLRMSPPLSPTPIVLSTDVPVAPDASVATAAALQTQAVVEAPPTQSPPTTSPVTPAPTLTQPAAAPASATPAGTETTPLPATAFDPYTVYGTPTYTNTMEVANYWEWAPPETYTLPNNERIRLQFDDGELVVTGKKTQFSTWWFSSHFLNDAYQQLTFNTEDCSADDAYGMILRGPSHLAGESYGYVVAFTCDGSITVSRLDDASPWDIEVLENDDEIAAINTGPEAQNVLGVLAEGNKFVVYANGVQVAEFEDDTFEKGRFGVFVRSAGSGAYTYRVTDLAYWVLNEDE